MGLIVVYVRVQPIIVALSGYLASLRHQSGDPAAPGGDCAGVDANPGVRVNGFFHRS